MLPVRRDGVPGAIVVLLPAKGSKHGHAGSRGRTTSVRPLEVSFWMDFGCNYFNLIF